MGVASLTIQTSAAYNTEDGGTETIGPITVTGGSSGITPVSVNQSSPTTGNVSVSVPTGSTGVIITPPASNTQALKVIPPSGNQGFPIRAANPSVMTWDPATAPATITLNCAGNVTGVVYFKFI